MTEDRKIKNVEEIIYKDKISELPEDLLVTILSLIPTKDAVATMFLSKRWLSVWTMIRTLEYKDIDEMKTSVWNFLDKSMQLHKAPVIDHLCVKLGQSCPTDVDVVKWVANAVSRCLLDLEFVLSWSADPTSLPYSLYSCESLVTLTLCHKILVDVPSPSCLPSLRELDLDCVVYKDEDSIVRFLSGCPVLKCLYVKRKKTDNAKKFTIKVPSLLELDYINRLFDYDLDDALVIDTPRLEDFSICDFFGDFSSIENMHFLKCAYISLDTCTSEKIISSVSSVSSLEFFLSDEMDWGSAKDITLSWNQPISTPGCLSSQLETFKWKEYRGTEGEEQFLRYVLASSKCLNTTIISLEYTLERNHEEKHLMMEKLKDIPRASTTSQLLFEYISFI
ncbi:PREDICTED: putative FBD-associated F-box protein At1g05080 [Camelina sativa]|uniref:FBD-associated F-box protein At1g05080 n=1 Tax=Camelina sativa TaxID=90675 RepID=A0ABM0XEQ6_CAMSA|nr:PREDICTED: putative FBD-associated F-box protein At1g05080 [Camelina sativa]